MFTNVGLAGSAGVVSALMIGASILPNHFTSMERKGIEMKGKKLGHFEATNWDLRK